MKKTSKFIDIKDLIKWSNIFYSHQQEDFVNMAVFPKLFQTFILIPIEIPVEFLYAKIGNGTELESLEHTCF